MIEDFEMRDDPGLSGWAQCNFKDPSMREAEGLKLEIQDTRLKREVRGWNMLYSWL